MRIFFAVMPVLAYLVAGFLLAGGGSHLSAADVIFVLDRGRVVERGTHTELLDRGGAYAQLYLHQVGSSSASDGALSR